MIHEETVAEQSAKAALDRIGAAKAAVEKADKEVARLKQLLKVAQREAQFAKADLERVMTTETGPNLFNQRQ